ncbi:hypothetical protein [Veillonella atypica]|jgi:hypothetical protein|uniref:hypothetical protein n=1 Tax=Veillonella atypica TaxID=39777 RepID=UPI002E764FD2|nr:hypothetical protein [Veillonella atypica]
MMSDNKNALASYVTFRQLFKSNTNEIFSIIKKFIEYIIVQRNWQSFRVEEIQKALKDEFEFDFPEAVIKTCLNKSELLTLSHQVYFRADTITNKKDTHIIKYFDEAKRLSEVVISRLNTFILQHEHTVDQNSVIKSFADFIINDDRKNNYSKYISAFILKNKDDDEVRRYIKLLSEGCILYTGLNYNADISNSMIWSEPIVICLEQEILFYLAGYNGHVFKKLIDDLVTLMNEMNKKAKKHVIKLAYFPDTKKDIQDFFYAAIKKLKNHSYPTVEQAAMNYILLGCAEEADIIEKQSDFFELLSQYGITEIDISNITNSELAEYNAIDLKLGRELEEQQIPYRYIEHLNNISLLRRGSDTTDLKKAKFILLTETRKILSLSQRICSQEASKNKMPLAFTMGAITRRLWFDLNKGFGGNDIPSSMDIWIKSQLALSTELDESFAEQYRKVKSRFDSGDLDEAGVKRYIVALKENYKTPDEIDSINVDDILFLIKEESIEELQARYVENERELAEIKHENIEMKEYIKEKDSLIKKHSEDLSSKDTEIKLLKKQRFDDLHDQLEEVTDELNDQKKRKISLEKYCIWLNRFLDFIILLIIGVMIFEITGLFYRNNEYIRLSMGDEYYRAIQVTVSTLIPIGGALINKHWSYIDWYNRLSQQLVNYCFYKKMSNINQKISKLESKKRKINEKIKELKF